MQHFLRRSLSLASATALALASSLPLAIRPAAAEEPMAETTEAADLGVMGIKLKDAVKLNWGFQGALQGAGTPNQSGIGGFLPLAIGDNSVFFLDAQANANFADFNEYSSIINTKVAGTTISTSSRLGYRWLNGDRSWMFGVNAGYDSRPMATGGTDNGVNVTNSRSVFFQQVALNLEAVSNKWFTSAYLLYPVGEYGFNKAPALINSFYGADSVMTVGTNIGYNLTPNLKASIGYYYSEGDAGEANGNSVKGRLEYNIANGLTTGINLAYDPAYSQGYSSEDFYKTLNLSADLKWRFGANGYGAPSIRNQQPVVMPVIQALSASPENRDVRVHDQVANCHTGMPDCVNTDLRIRTSCFWVNTVTQVTYSDCYAVRDNKWRKYNWEDYLIDKGRGMFDSFFYGSPAMGGRREYPAPNDGGGKTPNTCVQRDFTPPQRAREWYNCV